nr:uncharacterized protein CI109_005836 [Kwoniella shandongensis]KAA5525813.1 hypothetical protein CI109_005836 [Kwoniella shandongensis]
MPTQVRAPPGHPANFEEYETLSRSSSHSPPETDELWADPDDLLAIPTYDASIESTADPLFPSPHKFNLMVQDYLRNLSPKKREKALLTQKMYDAVLSVLQDPKDTGTKTAQFRFWAKKMFQLTTFGGEKVVCHDHKPVAVKEQIYEVLCHCHGQAGHGGRDKTSAQVRRYYSWIPKEIIARFVRDCPFCQSRRTQSSAGFSNMSESQAFLISLQASDTQLQSKRSVSLSQARANAAALGHKPYRRPSIRTIDSSRSRRGSAVSDDGFIHYNDGQMGMDGSVAMSVFEDCQYSSSSSGGYENTMGGGGGGLAPHAPSLPRRASSYHEQILLDVSRANGDLSTGIPMGMGMGMYRRNSESNILSASGSSSTMLYAEPFVIEPDYLNHNQNGVTNHYLSVPNVGGGGTLSRSTSSSSLGSLGVSNDDELADVRHFAQQLHLESGLGGGGMIKMDEYRDTLAVYSVGHSEAVTPNFPLTVQFQDMENGMSSYFPVVDYQQQQQHPASSYFPSSTTAAANSEYQFPALTLTSSTSSGPTSFGGQAINDDGGDLHNMWQNNHQENNNDNSSPINQAHDNANVEALAIMQRMFDSNNIFALGEAAGMTQDQVVEMGDIDPRILKEFQTQMEGLDQQLNPNTTSDSCASGDGQMDDVFTAQHEGSRSGWDSRQAQQSFTMEASTSSASTNMSTGTTGMYDLPSEEAISISEFTQAYQTFELAFNSQNNETDQSHHQSQHQAQRPDIKIENYHGDVSNPVDEGDLFAFSTTVTAMSGSGIGGCGSSLNINEHGVAVGGVNGGVDQQELDFSNWAGFVIS